MPLDLDLAPTEAPLRIATAGSVDDGKSTLIGRLLHDTKTILEDQLAAVERASHRYGDGSFNLALLTDGLRAEREQGITIDVAYRFFATAKRRFILADSPGHVQYTRNMVTAASSAGLAIVLVDAQRGVSPQTRRHAYIASLLGVSQIVVAVNKMDAVDWDKARYDEIASDLHAYLSSMERPAPVLTIPLSALNGDNVVEASSNTPWFTGPTLLEFIENYVPPEPTDLPARLDLQWVLRDYTSEYRGLAGRLAGGALAVGDTVTVLPSGLTSTVVRIDRGGESIDMAEPGQSISVVLADDIDASRGDVLLGPSTAPLPAPTTEVIGDICWMNETPLNEGDRVWFKHATRTGKAVVTRVVHRTDVETLQSEPATSLALNDLGRIELLLTEPILATPFSVDHIGGRLIVIDERTNTTSGAVLVAG